MKYHKTITLSNGKTCYLRNGTREDAKDVLTVFNKTHEETDFLLTYPEENSFSELDEANFLDDKMNSINEIEILAIVDNIVVGTAGIEAIGNKYKIKHRVDFGISILKDYCGMGIGNELLMACISCAKEAGYSQLELNVVAQNKNAISLYKKHGFIEFGRNPKGFNSKFCGFQELIYMYKDL